MSNPITVKLIGMDELRYTFDQVAKTAQNKRIVLNAANMLVPILLERFRSGRSVYGRHFRAYSTKPMYVDASKSPFKSLAKRGKTGKPTKVSHYLERGYAQLREEMGRVDTDRLIFTGRLLGNLTVKGHVEGAEIYFPNKHLNAVASGNQQRYEFFGLSALEQNIAVEYISEQIKNVLEMDGNVTI